MAYVAPQVDEMIYAKKNGVGVYTGPSTTSPRSVTNSEHDHQEREYVSGEAIGVRVDDKLYPSPDGLNFIKVRNWIWYFQDTGVFKVGLAGNNVQEFHENYVNVADEPEGWIRDTWRSADLTRSEQTDKAAEIQTAIKSFPGVPAPSSISKHTDDKGVDSWWVTFPNGYTSEWVQFQALSPATKISLTTGTVPKTGLTDGTGKDKETTTKTTLFTTTNILIGVGVLVLFAGLLVVLLRPQKK